MRGMGNMQGMMRQMQKLQKEMTKQKAELDQQVFTATANQVVTVTFTGDKKMKSIELKEDILEEKDIELLQDVITLAVNDCLQQIEQETEKKMGKYTKGIPGF